MSDADEVAAIESEIQNLYNETLKKESEDTLVKEKKQATEEFSKFRSLGFATSQEMKQAYMELKEENKKLRDEFNSVREFMLRKKAQGLAVLPTEEKKSDAELLKEIYGELAAV